jgi:hypothetical protein
MSVNKDKLLHDVVSQLSKKHAGKDLSEFLVRLGAQFGEVFAKFTRLYGERADFSNRFSELVLALAEMHLAREPELRDLDRQREEDKDWIMSPNWVATMLYVDRFSKNLKGFMQKIDYLEELGVNYVHLMPLLKMPQEANDGGYAVSDYRTVEKRFGSMADIRKIAKTFRAKNMLLELDLVLNHTSNEHEWAKKALQGEKEYQDMYYMYDDRSMPDAFEQTLPEIFPENAPGNFTYLPTINKWVFTVFNTYQWDLNYTNPKVFIEMIKILLNLANQGVDVLRLDAVAFMWKKLGTQSQNLDEAHILLQVMDYAVLTDNKGRKADCRHVILIMTSNAGAQFAHQASIGFSGQITAGEAMLKQVKKTFKPEFINRLSATVVFHDMDYGMASLILNKKLNELKNKLSARHVGMELSPEAYKHLLKLGFTKEYGAREMDRVITSQLKPLLMREILFGALKTGGKVRVTAGNGELSLQVLKE